ncbi:MAG: hypothetical protein MI741_04830, partial [Rhodospirillales bacterium]|nr:hypothetical protein [Rhodospirillales bacterium]
EPYALNEPTSPPPLLDQANAAAHQGGSMETLDSEELRALNEAPAHDENEVDEPATVIIRQHPKLALHRAAPLLDDLEQISLAEDDHHADEHDADAWSQANQVASHNSTLQVEGVGSTAVLDDAAVTREQGYELAEEVKDEPQEPKRPQRQAWVEAAILGNLPGLAGPWLTQYAQALAQQTGPIALLHVDEDAIDVELVEPTQRAAGGENPTASRTRNRFKQRYEAGQGVAALLDALVSDKQAPVRMVLVHLDGEPTPQAVERLLDLDYWTLLCGSDDAAVVGAYRQLKQLVELEDAVSDKHIGLMVMGSDEQAARTAAGKLRLAATSFLHTPLELVGHLKKMVPVNVRQLASFSPVEAQWHHLRDWLSTVTEPEMVIDPAEIEVPGVEETMVEDAEQSVTHAESTAAEDLADQITIPEAP